MFVEGAVYSRRKDIHEQFGGQQQGGVKSQNCCKFGPGYIVTATASG